jgi:hypothetical protein
MKRLKLAILPSVLALSFPNLPTRSDKPAPGEQNSTDKESRTGKPETVEGCYDIGELAWRPDFNGEDKVFITPPRRIQISSERGSKGFETNGYLVRPAPGIPPSVHRFSYWTPKGRNAIEIVWTTGLSGLTMELKLEGKTLRGKAKSFWDFARKHETAKVIANKVSCDE